MGGRSRAWYTLSANAHHYMGGLAGWARWAIKNQSSHPHPPYGSPDLTVVEPSLHYKSRHVMQYDQTDEMVVKTVWKTLAFPLNRWTWSSMSGKILRQVLIDL